MNNLSIRKNNELSKKKKKGFTLVELIIVIAIIAILAAMAIPKFSAVRIDAKVSNDVAAAKNIATVTSTLVANGKIVAPQTGIDVSGNVDIKASLDGKASSGKAEALISSNAFTVIIDNNEKISVQVDGHELYPDNDGAGKTAYVTAVKAQ